MRTLSLTLALVLLAAATAVAQIPRTINYQGRIADGPNPVNGPRTMTLKIYDAATGGATLFEETQTVNFSNGVFTAAIGGGTPGGIPATVTFDRQYWLGVTISGFNGDNELTPRFILRSSPYSLRAEVADSAGRSAGAVRALSADRADRADSANRAKVADSAYALRAPATLTLSKGTALRVKGEPFAIEAEGIMNTTRFSISNENGGNTAAPVVGAHYRDNVPMAWARVSRDGAIISDFGVDTVEFNAASPQYTVTLDLPAALVQETDLNVPEISPVISIGGLNTDFGAPDAQPSYAVWSFKRSPTGQGYDSKTIVIRIYNVQGTPVQRPFSITVFGRPQ